MKTRRASLLQAQFFLASQVHATPGLNTIACAVRIVGPLDVERLRNAVDAVVLQHESLRTHLATQNGAVIQVIDPEAKYARLEVIDESELAGLDQRSEALRRSLSPETATWKAQLFCDSQEDHTLLIAAHRCVCDERSIELLSRELSAAYAGSLGEIVAEDEQPLSVAEARVADNGARYFAESLGDASPLHGFPLKGPRPREMETETDSRWVQLEPEVSVGFERVAAELGVSTFAVQVAAVAYVLCSYCGEKVLPIGLPFEQRGHQTAKRIGCHTAMLPLGVDCTAGDFAELARRVAAAHDGGAKYALTPFDAILRSSGLKSDPSVNPGFQIACVQLPRVTIELPGCRTEALMPSAPPQQLDLFVEVAEDALRISYRTQIIASEMVTALSDSIAVFLRQVLADPTLALSKVALLSSHDIEVLTHGLNRTAEPSFLNQDLYAIISRHFESQPNRVAVTCNGSSLTYAELAASVDALASELLAADVGPGSLVGVCVNRSTAMLTALLAVLRCGAAYVPLDPAFPAERLEYMLEHSRLRVVLTTAALRDRFTAGERTVLEVGHQTPAQVNVPPPAQVPFEATAYVIYTSGSTGKPKGVAVPRGAAANFLLSMLERPGVTASDVLCAVTTLSFDIAVLELYAPLCAGGTVVIATEEEAKDPRLLMRLMEQQQVTVLQATPVTWQLLCAAKWQGNPQLSALCGGEPLPAALVRELLPRTKALWNMYGPTETTVWSTCQLITEPNDISVGTPIHNTFLYVVDDGLRVLPAGVEGRLLIGGSGVALGYLHDEEQTARRFVPDTFQGTGRMYDTGDRARRTAEGYVYIVGRSDFQVKFHGFRIELGDIETCLSRLKGIDQAVCMVRKDDPAQHELVAYYTTKLDAPELTPTVLRAHCASILPQHMIPTRFVAMDALPRTPNGKVDRKALPAVTAAAPAQTAATAVPTSKIERELLDIWSQVLASKPTSLHENFFDLGGTSLTAFTVVQEIARRFGTEVSVVKLFEHSTIAKLAEFLKDQRIEASFVRDTYQRARARRRRVGESATALDVAIIGMAGRFPGAANLDELWVNLREGKETVTTFSREELDPIIPESERNDPAYIPVRGVLENADLFDAPFFGISANEAELMDPQLRVFLECAWEAFEHSGYVGEDVPGDVGVWAGMGNNHYYFQNVLTRADKLAIMGEIAAEIANEKDHIAPRVSHRLNLTGPSLSVHAACSTALVVIDNAYQALITHQVDMALAGAVDIRTPQKSGQRFEEGGVFSIDGHCRPFDADATGTMFGEGVGAVVLKRLDDALRDGDTIYGVIKGTNVNHDGGHKVSYLAPSVEGQARVVAGALGLGDIHPDTISYIEAHGTATPIGDPIEVEALTRVYRTFTERRGYCGIGSIKGNFGHATTAAGIAGAFKVLLGMKHRQIPPTVHFKKPNPRIDFASSPFFVVDKLLDWVPQGDKRRATVSSFGFCGTNAHAVLEEAPEQPETSAPAHPWQLLLISARHPVALEEGTKRLGVALAGKAPNELADAAFTTHVGRRRFEHRRYVVVDSAETAARVLAEGGGSLSASLKSEADNPPVAFLFPGQGSQYVNMGLNLYHGEPLFRQTVDQCAKILEPHLGCDLRTFLFPNPGDEETARKSLNNTFYTQPAIFTMSYSIATLLQHWGIKPSVFVGHSIGEFVAATFAKVMALEDALRLVATRGRLMQGLPGGSMLTVRMSVDAVTPRLKPGVDVAAVNGPELTVVAGPTDAVEALKDELSAEGVLCRVLHTSHAFHSSMMEPVVEPFLKTVQSVSLSEPQIPFVSTVTGDWIKPEEATNPEYWARHLRAPVLFSKAVQVLLADEAQVLIECGPRRTCASLALQHRPRNPARVIATMPDSAEPSDEYPNLLQSLGAMWLNGIRIDWENFHEREQRRRTALPTYAFQRRRYWIEPGAMVSHAAPVRDAKTAVATAAVDAPGATSGADEIETTVVGLLEELLGSKIENFDADARFIMLGLDSLLLTQLARIVRLRLGFEASFRDLVERYPNTRLLVEAIRASQPAKAQDGPPSVSGPPSSTGPMGRRNGGVDVTFLLTPGAPRPRVGYDSNGQLAWFIPDPHRTGKFLQLPHHE